MNITRQAIKGGLIMKTLNNVKELETKTDYSYLFKDITTNQNDKKTRIKEVQAKISELERKYIVPNSFSMMNPFLYILSMMSALILSAIKRLENLNSPENYPYSLNPSTKIPDYGKNPTKVQIKQLIEAAAVKYGIPPDILKAVAWQESAWNPKALSFDGQHGKGVMQIDDRFHKFASTPDVFDPVKNIEYGARYLSNLYKETGSWKMALKRYNGGGDYPPLVFAHVRNKPWEQYAA